MSDPSDSGVIASSSIELLKSTSTDSCWITSTETVVLVYENHEGGIVTSAEQAMPMLAQGKRIERVSVTNLIENGALGDKAETTWTRTVGTSKVNSLAETTS